MEPRADVGMLIGASRDGIVCLDEEGRIVLFNQAAARLLQVDANEAVGKAFDQYLIAASRDSLHTRMAQLSASTLNGFANESPLRWDAVQPDGATLPVEASVTLTLTSNERLFTLFLRDITDAVEADRRLSEVNAELLKSVGQLERRASQLSALNALGELLQSCLTDSEVFAAVQRHAPVLLGGSGTLAVAELGARRLQAVASWGPRGPLMAVGFVPDDCWALRRGQAFLSLPGDEQLVCHHLGGPITGSAQCVPLAARGEMLGVLSVAEPDEPMDEGRQRLVQAVGDLVKLALANLRLQSTVRDHAVRDRLTGLFNRVHFHDAMVDAVARAEREERPLSLLILDIDDFSGVNRASGSDEADRVLREVAGLANQHARPSDTLARIGADDFALLMPDTELGVAVNRARRIGEAVQEHFHARPYPGGGLHVSVGVATLRDHASNAGGLLQAAELALAHAKGQSRTRVTVFEPPAAPADVD